jgi:phospholipase A1/A2
MIRASMSGGKIFSALLFASTAGLALAEPPASERLEHCARITNPDARLACFDRVVPEPTEPPGDRFTPAPEDEPSLIGDRWGIGISDRDSRFDLRPHKSSYLLLGRYSDAPNTLPTSPTKQPLAEPLDIDPTEAKFQFSFKVKLADLEQTLSGLPPAAVWVGYTQQSQWQVYNPHVSRPFRETNYEPELMLAFFPDRNVLGWRWRLAVLGLNHQSNGRSDPLSRSWNRVFAMFGFERDNVAVLVRPWVRLKEHYNKDDNPDLTRYLGYGDVTTVYKYAGHTLSLLVRYNPASGRGALQAAWNFPLHRRVRGYLQWFSGYGESLIDYNWRQNTVGIGVSLSDAL